MVKLHHTVINLLHIFQTLRFEPVVELTTCLVRDDSMFPKYRNGESVQIDRSAPAKNGDVVAIATDDFIDLREVLFCNGDIYLIAHNRRFPKISLRDYRALYPGTFFAGVVC